MVGSCWELTENCTSVCRVSLRQDWELHPSLALTKILRASFRVRVTVFSGRFADVSNRQLTALKVKFYAYFLHEIRAYQTCCFSRKRAHQKLVPVLSSSHVERNRVLASNIGSFPSHSVWFEGGSSNKTPRYAGLQILEPVSTIRLLVIPSISIVMKGVPCSRTNGTKDAMTAFSGVLGRREMPSLAPLSSFPDFLFLSENRVWVNGGLSREGPERLQRSVGHFTGGLEVFASLFRLVGYSRPKWLKPPRSKHLRASLVRELLVPEVIELRALVEDLFR